MKVKNIFSLMTIIMLLISCNAEIDVERVVKADSDSDITPLEPKQATFTKLSTASAIYEGSNNSIDCGYYLIGIRNSQRPTTFVYNNKVYFNIPCKTSDSSAGGWHWGLANWSPGGNIIWHDGKAAAGENELMSTSEIDQNGFILRSVKNTYMVDTGSGILGLTYKYFRNTEYTMANVPGMFPASAVVTSSGYYPVGLATASPESLVPTDVFVDENKYAAIFADNDDTWKGSTHKTDLDLHYDSGTVYIYNTTQNAPTKDTYYISITTSTDMKTFNLPTNYLFKDYRSPHVFNFSGKIYMLAFSKITNRWTLIPGSSPTSFDEDNAQTLDLGVEIYGTGNWDDTPLFTTHPEDQPEVAGVEVIDGKVYVFYMAGQFGQVRAPANGVTGSPYDSARGIGVFELEI